MLLSTREYEIIKNSALWKEGASSYVVPPFIFKDKKIKFPKLPAHLANDLVNQEKENRDIEFEN